MEPLDGWQLLLLLLLQLLLEELQPHAFAFCPYYRVFVDDVLDLLLSKGTECDGVHGSVQSMSPDHWLLLR
jgi:hypothetical protein